MVAFDGSKSFVQRFAPLLACLCAAAAVAGCGGGGGGGGDDASSTADEIGFHANRKVYALPLDQIRAIDDGTIGYAASLLTKDCMEGAGFPWPVPTFDPTVRPPATWNATGRRLFDVEIASRYGYHLAPATDSASQEMAALNARQLSSAEQVRLRGCRARVERRLPAPESRLVDSLAGAAYDAALADAATEAAGRRWHACLAPAGVSDLPDMPNRMPSPSVARRFRLGLPGGTASPQEIALATTDARCRESSGYARTLYAQEVDQQLTLFARNRDALERSRTAMRAELRRARTVVAEHGA